MKEGGKKNRFLSFRVDERYLFDLVFSFLGGYELGLLR